VNRMARSRRSTSTLATTLSLGGRGQEMSDSLGLTNDRTSGRKLLIKQVDYEADRQATAASVSGPSMQRNVCLSLPRQPQCLSGRNRLLPSHVSRSSARFKRVNPRVKFQRFHVITVAGLAVSSHGRYNCPQLNVRRRTTRSSVSISPNLGLFRPSIWAVFSLCESEISALL
jgi:hypothetical protein